MEPGPPGSEEVTAENTKQIRINQMSERADILTFALLSMELDYWITT